MSLSKLWYLIRTSPFSKSATYMIIMRALSILIGLAFVVLMATWLGTEGYGQYFFTVTLASLLALPVLAGLPTLVVREVAQARGRQDGALIVGIMRWSAWFVLVTSLTVATFGGLILFGLRGYGESWSIYTLALPLIVALGAMQLSAAYLQGHEQPVLGSLPDGLIRPGLLLGMAACAALVGSLTPQLAILAHIMAALLATGWAVIISRRFNKTAIDNLPQPKPRYETRAWLSGLLPLSLITGAALLNNRLDVIMLGWLADFSEVGRYGIAMQIAGLVAVGPTIINSISQPRIARLHGQQDRDTMQHELTQAARLGLGLSFAVMGVLALIAEPIILVLLGEEFHGAIPALIVLGGGRVVLSAMGPVGNALNMTGNAPTTAWLTLAFSVVNAILNASLIPLCGAVGAASATVLSLFGLHIAMIWQARRLIGVDTTIFGWRVG